MKWQELLRRMKLESIKSKAPGFFELSGRYELKTKPYSDTTANGLTRCVEDFINNYPGEVGEASRINSTGTPRKMHDGSIKWSNSNTKKGIADIKGTFRGKALNIEVKIGRDRQSEVQRKEQERIIKAGGIYWLVNNFPQFLELWQREGFEIPNYEPMKRNRTV